MKKQIYNCVAGCEVESAVQLIAGRWKSVILYHLIHDGDLRYSELQRLIPGIERRTLSLQLRGMEDDHLIKKVTDSFVEDISRYQITEFGLQAKPAIIALYQMGLNFNKENQGKYPVADLISY